MFWLKFSHHTQKKQREQTKWMMKESAAAATIISNNNNKMTSNKITKSQKTTQNIRPRNKKKKTAKQVKKFFDSVNQSAVKNERDAPGLCFFSKCLRSKKNKNIKPSNNEISENWKKQNLKQMGWGSDTFSSKPVDLCRCELCELKSVVKQIAKRCKTVVLLDLDNWGWKQWSSNKNGCTTSDPTLQESKGTSNDTEQNILYGSSIFCWSFYGGGFVNHLSSEEEKDQFSTWDSQIQKINNNNNSSNNDTSSNSSGSGKPVVKQASNYAQAPIFQQFLHDNKLRFSPTGWSDQSADLAIRKMCKLLLQKLNVCVITRDEDLRLECERMASDQHASFGGTDRRRFICIRPNVIGYKNVISHLLNFHNEAIAK